MAPLVARRATLALSWYFLFALSEMPSWSADGARLTGHTRSLQGLEQDSVIAESEYRRLNDRMNRRQKTLRKGLIDKGQTEVNAVNTLEGFSDVKITSSGTGASSFELGNVDDMNAVAGGTNTATSNAANAPKNAAPKGAADAAPKANADATPDAANTGSSGIQMSDFSWGRFMGNIDPQTLEAAAAVADTSTSTSTGDYDRNGVPDSNLIDDMMGEYGITVFKGNGGTNFFDTEGGNSLGTGSSFVPASLGFPPTSPPTTSKPSAVVTSAPTNKPLPSPDNTVEADVVDTAVIDTSGADNIATTGCSLCPNGATATKPTRTLLGTDVSCQLVANQFAAATDADVCNAQKAQIPLNLEAYCGCPGATATVTCTFCPEGERNIWHNITVEGLSGWTCQDVEDYTSLITDTTACANLNPLKDMCCGTEAEFWGEEDGNN